MSIRIKRYIEPLSLASRRQVPVIVESDAYRQVCTDLEMYVNGEILGRSFLIAGHRGAGKTTMLRQAVQEVESRIRRKGEASGQHARPLFVALHGPDLLAAPPPGSGNGENSAESEPKAKGRNGSERPAPAPDLEAAAAARAKKASAADADAKKDPAAPREPPPPAELFHFLDRVTSGLYFGAAHEFARCFRDVARKNVGANRSDLIELAADLHVQLDRQPDLDRLREYWNRVKALDRGVLFDVPEASGRGVEEVTALFSIGRAMRTFTGTVNASLVTEANRKREASASLVTIDGQNLLPPLIGLASGALVWGALPGTDPLVKSFSALLTGLGAVLALKITANRSRSSEQTWKETFIPKDDPGSLYRVLPALIERFQAVGLYPVFVVDELDKVSGLGEKVNSLLGYMKQFVTERAFFCFVANRSFYQQANAQASATAYSTLHTRFGDSVFVRYRAQDFHEYLTEMIAVDGSGLSPTEIDKAEGAAAMLRYMLLSRSYLHPYDLRRELAQGQDSAGTLLQTADELLNSPRIQREVATQVAVEAVFAGPALREYVRDPVVAQTALDALYYPVRMWRDGNNTFNLTQQELTQHLIGRTGIQEEIAAGETKVADEALIPMALQKTLHEQVERLMGLLVDPAALADEAARVSPPAAVARMLTTLDPLVERHNTAPHYRFRYDARGMERQHHEAKAPAPVPGQPAEPAAAARAVAAGEARFDAPRIIKDLREWLAEHPDFGLDMGILEEREVLSSPPHWNYVSNAPPLTPGQDPTEARAVHTQAVRKYARMLGKREAALDQALALSAYASFASRSQDPAEKLRDALRALPKGGEVKWEPGDPHLGIAELHWQQRPTTLEQGKVQDWAATVLARHEGIVSSGPFLDWEGLEDRSWSIWQTRLEQFRRTGRGHFDTSVTDYLLRTRSIPPATLFRNDLELMTLREWSEALLLARRYDVPHSTPVPAWVESDIRAQLHLEAPIVLLVVGESAKTPSAQWLPSRQYGSLWFERARWFDAYDALDLGSSGNGKNVFIPGAQLFVAVEVTGDPAALEQAVRTDVATTFGAPPLLPVAGNVTYAYLGKDKLPPQVTPTIPYLENVKSVDEAVRRLEQIRRTPAPRP